MFGFSTAKLIAMGVGALAVIVFVVTAFSWRSEMIELQGWQGEVVKATRDASGQPKLGKDGVAQQVRLLGQAKADLESALKDQNAKILAISANDRARQEEAAKARQAAQEARSERDGVIARLNRSARTSGPPGKDCEPSEALQEQWR